MYFIYELFGFIFIIFSPFIILYRIITGKEDPDRFFEKFCIYSNKNNKKKVIWMHGSSVGELLSIIPIVKKLEKNNKIKQILITSSTTSSALVFSKYKFRKTIHRFFPIDINFFSKKFIKYWNPQIAIFVESEIWPNMIKNLHINKTPIILLNARITKKTFKKWKYFSNFSKKLFGKISLSLPQNLETFSYLKNLGVKNIKISGNLKFYGEKKIEKINPNLKNKFKNRKIWCAASTHYDEEIFIGKLHKKIKSKKKNLLTILIPRHVNRSDEIVNNLNNIGLKTISHSSKEKIQKDTDVYLVDVYGEASKFYKLCKTTFLGGSLKSSVHHGGQNPLEPARLGNYILHGPKISNFQEVYSMLKKLKISSKINNLSEIEKILVKNIEFKQSNVVNKKLFSIGEKILNQNLVEIKKFL